MSEDILSKLKELHQGVQARIEATSDYKAMKAVERGQAGPPIGTPRRVTDLAAP